MDQNQNNNSNPKMNKLNNLLFNHFLSHSINQNNMKKNENPKIDINSSYNGFDHYQNFFIGQNKINRQNFINMSMNNIQNMVINKQLQQQFIEFQKFQQYQLMTQKENMVPKEKEKEIEKEIEIEIEMERKRKRKNGKEKINNLMKGRKRGEEINRKTNNNNLFKNQISSNRKRTKVLGEIQNKKAKSGKLNSEFDYSSDQNESFGINELKALGLECLYVLRALKGHLDELVQLKKQQLTVKKPILNDAIIDTFLVEDTVNWIIKNWKSGRPVVNNLIKENLKIKRELTKAEKEIIIQKLGEKERHWRASLRRSENSILKNEGQSFEEALIQKMSRYKTQFHGLNKEWQMWLVDTRQCYSYNKK
ncbi:hypothetical protein M0812_07237 [Anaeramoeba flamelloides]|uniref:Uncharacterized protein n=1 Tax=Anaeramoeba flamelloides TaxID=1746091 RepID=A0AAV8ABL5_9EUKA|nr:hypothetical protein M0812_07237 [Anaeramoeba flamelloides]